MSKVRVRIAVAVGPDGDWNSAGWRDGDDKTKMELCTETVQNGEARYWLEAELDVPEPMTVNAAVV